MDSLRKATSSHEGGAALIIVLAFVVLLTGLLIAYLSQTTSDRPVAQSSFNQSEADQLAASATDNIIGDLRKEIVDGSNPPIAVGSSTIYIPTTNPLNGNKLNMLPMCSPTPTPGTTPAIPNLIRRSIRSDGIPSPAPTCRASAVNSTGDVSANGRSITLARWNSHYLIPKLNTGDDKSDPITTGFSPPNYWAPDWVFVTNNGASVITQPSASVIGRYAYALYDEDGLLDMNAAGYPSTATIIQCGRKGSLAFADLRGLGSFGLSTTGIDNTIGWRNYASSQPTGNFSSNNLTFSTTAANTYYNFILSDPNYIKLTSYSPNYFLQTSQAPTYNNQTDQAFTTRQELIALRKTTQFSSNALQYLGTFSRE